MLVTDACDDASMVIVGRPIVHDSPQFALPVPSPEERNMSTLTRFARTFARAEDGATTAEYGIIIVVVAGIAIFVLSQLNGALNALYGKFGSKVNLVN